MKIGNRDSISRPNKTERAGAAKRTQQAGAAGAAGKVFEVDTSSASGDSVDEIAAESGAEALGGGSAALGIGSLLALQETQLVEERQQQNQEQLAYGQNLLHELQKLQRELLSDDVDAERLDAIVRLVRHHKNRAGTDSRLEEIIAQIETRVVVELAKYGKDV